MSPYFIRFLAVSFFAAACMLTYHLSHAQDTPDVGPQEEQATTIPNARPAGPGDFGPGNSPQMWIGVKACGVYVIWLVFDQGSDPHISVVDQKHHPKDMKEFMSALENSHIPHDERTIECASADL